MKKLQILLAEDHLLVREGLRLLINRQPDMNVAGEASDGQEAVEMVHRLKPDLVLMDLSMPGMNGLQAINAIKAKNADAKVVVLTTHEDQSYFRQVCQAGASGYLVKRMAGEELVKCIRKVASGQLHFDGVLAGKAFARQFAVPATKTEFKPLSAREEEVLLGVAWGYTNKELAEKLGISVKTIETHKVRVCEKLRLRSRADLVRYAVREGLLNEAPHFGNEPE